MNQSGLRSEINRIKKAMRFNDDRPKLLFATSQQEMELIKEEYGDDLKGVIVFQWRFPEE